MVMNLFSYLRAFPSKPYRTLIFTKHETSLSAVTKPYIYQQGKKHSIKQCRMCSKQNIKVQNSKDRLWKQCYTYPSFLEANRHQTCIGHVEH